MTEQQLTDVVGLVARCRRLEQLAESNRDAAAAHEALRLRYHLEDAYGVVIEPRGWRPPVSDAPGAA